jgi:hypothetical protein
MGESLSEQTQLSQTHHCRYLKLASPSHQKAGRSRWQHHHRCNQLHTPHRYQDLHTQLAKHRHTAVLSAPEGRWLVDLQIRQISALGQQGHLLILHYPKS